MSRKRQSESVRRAGRSLVAAVMLFFFSAFLLLALRDNAWQGYALAAAVPAMVWLGTYLLPRLIGGDRLLLSLTNFLCALGVLVLYDTNPAYAYHQVIAYGVGLAAMTLCIRAVQWFSSWRLLILLMAPVSLVLLALPLVFGREIYGARNWLFVGGISVQPSEIVKISLLIILARAMSRRRFWFWSLFVVACLGLLMLQKDLGTALLYFSVALLMYYAATGSLWVLAAGAAGGTGAALLGYRMFAHVKRRVAIWRNPWADYDNAGYQLVQGLMAIASGGLWGVGLGLGSPRTIPVYHTDFIFAVICEQFGLIFGLCVLAMYVALAWRGATIAMGASHSFHGLLAMGATLMLGLQTFVIIGGVLKLIPLTGVTMPFVSYGGSSLVSSMCLVGLIQGVASRNEDDLAEDTRLALAQEEVGL
ncbi:MAG: FtsW/RodA/SpoVE family cell cycle protein [Clostridia bacterium]|nr:FtsW/RodA/SpoVE family cell cycle protein [Clostridia bacterium]